MVCTLATGYMWLHRETICENQARLEQEAPTSISGGGTSHQAYKGADPDHFQYYVINGFIVSDNLSVNSLKMLDLYFEHPDHNPLLLPVTLL